MEVNALEQKIKNALIGLDIIQSELFLKLEQLKISDKTKTTMSLTELECLNILVLAVIDELNKGGEL